MRAFAPVDVAALAMPVLSIQLRRESSIGGYLIKTLHELGVAIDLLYIYFFPCGLQSVAKLTTVHEEI